MIFLYDDWKHRPHRLAIQGGEVMVFTMVYLIYKLGWFG